eukprot:TRINITY_DN12704_c0_g1_i2.p1 TRINITY_DN12704_c0_g1~~TRINITY_DN12704_c0_g1_i2.p1  ORF type:complete len:170 (+),score=6.58 TRINITY_DN12704_c0_g1_i2:264-773(+)
MNDESCDPRPTCRYKRGEVALLVYMVYLGALASLVLWFVARRACVAPRLPRSQFPWILVLGAVWSGFFAVTATWGFLIASAGGREPFEITGLYFLGSLCLLCFLPVPGICIAMLFPKVEIKTNSIELDLGFGGIWEALMTGYVYELDQSEQERADPVEWDQPPEYEAQA